jgi:hypothetical protein
MNRNKTQRRRTPVSDGPFLGDNTAKSTETSLDALFAAETATFKQPWQKLDRGSRLDRLRKFVHTYEPTGKPLSPAERASLLTAILKSFELRQLNSKLAVDYDPEAAVILSIRGLHVSSAPGLRTFAIDPTPTRATQRRKAESLNAEAST